MSNFTKTIRAAAHRNNKRRYYATTTCRPQHPHQRLHRTDTTLCLLRLPFSSVSSVRYHRYSTTVPNFLSSAPISYGNDEITGPVSERLDELVNKGNIHPDDHQLMAARELDRIYHDLMEHNPPPLDLSSTTTTTSSSSFSGPKSSPSFFGSLFGPSVNNNSPPVVVATASGGLQSNLVIPGCYMYGGVGCGKTFLMELLYQSIGDTPDSVWAHDRQLVHYHKFMLNVHQFMHTSRKEQREMGITDVNLIDPVVSHILQRGRLLCLDEFQVTDVADAMILKSIFTGLWNQGCVLITTSNRPPRDLYLHGLQRDRFVPFIDMLERRCHVVSLMGAETDYRMMMADIDAHDELERLEPDDDVDGTNPVNAVQSSTTTTTTTTRIVPKKVYFTKDQKKDFQKLFTQMTKDRPCNPTTLETQGRKVKIPMACKSKSIAMFSFEDLCQKALGAADYRVIGQQFSTVFLHGIPKLTIHELNWLRRFITFVDTMYELKVTLVLHTNSPGGIDEIFIVDGDKKSYSHDEVFAFDRTRSRLQEMSSGKYLSSAWSGSSFSTTDDHLSSSSSRPVVTTRLDMEPSLADNPHHHR